MTFSGTALTLANDATISGLTVGKGGGSVATNTVVGASALTATNTGGYCNAFGQNALAATTTGVGNIAIGVSALLVNTSGSNNVAIGSYAGADGPALRYNTSGSNNIAIGRSSLLSNTTGGNNVAVGHGALYTSTTGSSMVAIGFQAAYATTTDDSITAVGYRALYSNTTGGGGSASVAVGKEAMYYNTTGYYNVAVGYRAFYNQNSSSNTGLGFTAGQSVTSGSGNTFVGYNTGKVCTTGSANIHLGYGTSTSSVSVGNEIVISTNSDTGKGSQTGFIAPGFGSCYQGSNSGSWATTSDRRLKKNITDNTEGLSKIAQIRVRNFEYRLPEEVDAELKPTDAVRKTGVQLGVIAQELQEVCPDCVKEESTGVLRVDSDNVFWHMVNAIKELKAEFDAYKLTHP
jgi:hypothetical protein